MHTLVQTSMTTSTHDPINQTKLEKLKTKKAYTSAKKHAWCSLTLPQEGGRERGMLTLRFKSFSLQLSQVDPHKTFSQMWNPPKTPLNFISHLKKEKEKFKSKHKKLF